MRRCLLTLALLVGSILAADEILPTIITPSTAKVRYFTRDEKVELKCEAKGEPFYQWFWDGTVITDETDRQNNPLLSFDSKTGTLTIAKYSDRYNGDYYCVATIKKAASMSQTQTLRETRLPAFIKADANKVTVTAYTYVRLKCSDQGDVVADPNDLAYNWYRKKDTQQISTEDGRNFVDSLGDLHFTYVLKSDETVDDDTTYLCGYSSLSSKNIKMGNFNELKVEKADAEGTRPTFQYKSIGVQGQIGNTARLECFFSGYDGTKDNRLPTIKWFDSENNELRNSDKYSLSSYNRVLEIRDLKEEDDKNFHCQGFTKSGNTAKYPVYLNVTSKPIWEHAPKTQTKPEKEDVVFNCKARSLSNEAEPEPPIWYINGKQLSPQHNHKKYVPSADRKTLTITDLEKPTDILCVQCKVSNSVGDLMGDACLNVVSPIKLNTVPPREQRIKKGDTVNLTIQASSDDDTSSVLTYEWRFNNATYERTNLPSIVTYDPRSDQTFINTSKISDKEYDKLGGVYILRVYNLYDSKEHKVTVILTDAPPPAPVAASAGMDMWIIGLIIGIIFLIIVIAIIIFVICRKQQEGDYNVDKKETGAGLDPEKELRDKGFNDLSRPDYDDYDFPEKKPRGDLEYDDVPIGGDDESLGEYGDEEDTHFNEDGSFIGIYQKKENERQNHKTESTI